MIRPKLSISLGLLSVFAAGALLVAGMLLAVGVGAQEPGLELNAQEELGKHIYTHGENPSGREITASLGEGAEVAAALLPCASCHGEDGRGRPEGGVNPSDVTWKALTRPYNTRHPSGREHPPYNESTLKIALTLGRDPGGNDLHVAMPRYRLNVDEANALVAYLKRLGTESQPGVDDEELRLGVLLPPEGHYGDLGNAVRNLVSARLQQTNDQGGVYHRQLKVFYLRPPVDAVERRKAVADFLKENDIFALAASFLVGADAELAALANEERVPVVGPFTARPQVDFPLNRHVFYVLAGYEIQVRALVTRAAAQTPEPSRVLVLYASGSDLEKVAEAVVDQGRQNDVESGTETAWSGVLSLHFPPGAFRSISDELIAGFNDNDVIVFLGSEGDAKMLYAQASDLGWRPKVLLLQALSGKAPLNVGRDLAERTSIAFPSLPNDYNPRSLAAYDELTVSDPLAKRYAVVQLGALAALELLIEGLQRAGRDLNTEVFIKSLEELYNWESGLAPPLTYGPNQRIGAAGAYIVSPDMGRRRYPEEGAWIVPR